MKITLKIIGNASDVYAMKLNSVLTNNNSYL